MNEYRELYRAEQLPIFQNRMFNSSQEARDCVRGDVVLVQDLKTGLIFNSAFQSELMNYDENYQNEQAVSKSFQIHLNNVADVVSRHFHGKLIEVGCGKAHFLEQLQSLGFDITGVDPTYEGTNPNVIKEYFSSSVGVRGDGIILRHVLEHIRNPVDFLADIRDANGGGGTIYIEVPCFDWICNHRSWFDVFYEHVNYFRLGDFDRMFGKVYESGRTFGDQYLYVVADLKTLRTPAYHDSTAARFPNDFLRMVERYATRLKENRKRAPSDARQLTTVWGGASKGVIFSLFMDRAGAAVDLVVDINPAKQGRYLPATGLRVNAPTEAISNLLPGSEILVMNGNYLPEIKQLTREQFNYLLVENAYV